MKDVVIRVVNAQGVSERAPWDEIEKAIAKPSIFGDVDAWLVCECAWADLDAIARRHGLHALQYGTRGSAKAGVGILSRDQIGERTYKVGSPAAGGVRLRPLVTGRTFGFKVTAAHAPPPRNPVARATYLARVGATGGIVGGDFNREPGWMRSNFGRRYRGDGVLGVLVPRKFKVSGAHVVNVGSDHPAVDVRVRRDI